MATITPRKSRKGTRYRALVRLKELGRPLCRTFDTRDDAERWAGIQEGKVYGGEDPSAGKDITLAQAIATFRTLREESNPVKAGLNARLNALERHLGHRKLSNANFNWLREYGSLRTKPKDGSRPVRRSTVQGEITTLGTVIKEVGHYLRATFPKIVNGAARRELRDNYRVIGNARERDRRPEGDELKRILSHLPAEYRLATRFAALSAMRRGEVCSLLREDFNREHQTIIVRGRKHPSDDERDMEVPLLLGAYEVLIQQVSQLPDVDGRVFPIAPKEWWRAWADACKAAGVKDLRIHDLRHEAISALFEAGYEIQEVVLVSGHLTWSQLRRYTNLKPRELKHGPAKLRRLKVAA